MEREKVLGYYTVYTGYLLSIVKIIERGRREREREREQQIINKIEIDTPLFVK